MHRHLRYNRDLWPEVFDFGTAHSIDPLTPLSPLGDLVWVWPVWPVWPGRGCVGNPGDWRRNSLACSKNCLFLFAIFWYILIHFTLSEFRFSISTSKRFCHLLCPLVLFHSARGLNGAEILVLVSALGEACKFFANALDSSSWNAEKAIRNDWRDLERFRTVHTKMACLCWDNSDLTTSVCWQCWQARARRTAVWDKLQGCEMKDVHGSYWGLLCCSVSRSSSRKDNLWHPVCFISSFLQRS